MYASCVKQRFVAALIHDYLNYKPFEKYLLRLNKIRCLILQKKKKRKIEYIRMIQREKKFQRKYISRS